MKHLLYGVAIAAVLAIATPVMAQNAPMTPSQQKPPAAAPAAGAPAAPAATSAPRQRHRAMRHSMRMRRPMMMRAHRRGGMMMGSGDGMTDQLNRQELARIQGGGGMMPPGGQGQMMGGPPMGQPMMSPNPMMQQGPRPSGH